MKILNSLAKESVSPDHFIFNIQQNHLLDLVYQWEKETPERIKKYKNIGWFTIAADYWEENH